MSSQADAAVHSGPNPGLELAPWVGANAIGLATTFALFGLVGEGMEALGAEHDTVAWGVPTLTAMAIGGSLFAYLRRRVLGTARVPAKRNTLLIGVLITAGFVAGWIPPLDFVTGIWVAGISGTVLQLTEARNSKGRHRRLVLVGVAAWLAAGIAAVAVAVLIADVLLSRALGLDAFVDGTGGFIVILTLVGLVGGAVGATIQAVAIRRSAMRPHPAS